MTCPACTTAAQQVSAMFVNGCPCCMARSAARSPQYREARDAGRITHGYRLLLEGYYGAGCDLAQAHERVKAAAAVDFEAKERAE
ncbi:MAG: hypothetical protein JNN18_09475 [Rubrivivax sp.]|nr:hypothetical protein [Rubrivivax sp.]